MSAIFGIHYPDGKPVASIDLERMRNKLAHRGPDGSGVWRDRTVGLGHCLMWVTPESFREHLPAPNRPGDLCITADARLDNRAELICSLGLGDRPAQEISDSELILAAYEKWGDRVSEKLLGDFVFAIWDARNQSLFCARDPLGVKHFYYYHSGQIFAFASEIKALLCLSEVPRKLNELSIAAHLLPFYEDKVGTLYEGVLRVPAAHNLVVRRGQVELRQYWSPDLTRELRLGSDEEYAEAFRDIFSEAVSCRLRSAFPIGSMLSGGLDSSSISCTASKLLARDGRGPLHTFSGIFPSLAEVSPKIDERRYAQAVVAIGGIEPHYIRADNFSPLTDLSRIFWYLDNSLPAANMYMDWAIFQAAQEQGVRVLFSGNDGDTIVSFGLEDLFEYVRRWRWLSLCKEAAALSRYSGSGKRWHTFKRLVWNEAFRHAVPEPAKQVWRILHGRSPRLDETPMLPVYCRNRPINPEFARRINLIERIWDLQNASFPSGVTTREGHWQGINSGIDCFLLESFEKAGAALSLEVRFPFFDRRLIEFCLALPPGQKLHRGWTRSILRRAMTGTLPSEVQWRRGKSDISANIKLKLLEYERETLEDVIIDHPETIREYVDVPSLRAAYKRYLADPLKGDQEHFIIALAVNLALWLRVTEFSSQSAVRDGQFSVTDNQSTVRDGHRTPQLGYEMEPIGAERVDQELSAAAR